MAVAAGLALLVLWSEPCFADLVGDLLRTLATKRAGIEASTGGASLPLDRLPDPSWFFSGSMYM